MSMMRRRLLDDTVRRTAEGEAMAVRSVARMRPGLSIFGKSTQDTTTGAQLFDASEYVRGGFINEAGDEQNGNQSYNCSGFCKLSPQTRYVLSNTGTESKFYYDVDKAFISYENTTTSFTTPDNAEYIRFNFSNTINENNIMLNAGTTALPWEPYTGGQPSPNPDYPQEIVSVGDDGEIGVNVYGGNLLTDTTEKVISGDIGTNVNNVSARYIIVADKNLLDKELIFSFDSDSNIGKDFVCQTNATTDEKSNWSAETVKQIVKGRNYFPLAKTFDEIPENNIINFYVHLRVYEELDEAIQFTISNPMLNIGSTALPFEPYKQPQSLIVSTPDGLPGIPVSSGGNYTDGNGQRWVCDEVDFKRGKYVKRTELLHITDFSEVSNPTHTDMGNTECNIQILGHYPDVQNMSHVNSSMCDSFIYSAIGDYERFAIGSDAELRVYFTLNGVLSREEFIAKMEEISPTILFPLATPIETDLTPEQITAYQSLHTNYSTTTVMNDSDAGMKLTYKTRKSLEVT